MYIIQNMLNMIDLTSKSILIMNIEESLTVILCCFVDFLWSMIKKNLACHVITFIKFSMTRLTVEAWYKSHAARKWLKALLLMLLLCSKPFSGGMRFVSSFNGKSCHRKFYESYNMTCQILFWSYFIKNRQNSTR